MMKHDVARIREAHLASWNMRASLRSAGAEDELHGSSPPSVFVGSYGYPKVGVGPLAPRVHGNTSMYDAPEHWGSKTLEDIISYRLDMVRGVRSVRADDVSGRYVGSLQEIAMSSRPSDIDLSFESAPRLSHITDDTGTLFGSTGTIKKASFANASSLNALERAYADTDAGAREVVLEMYRAGVDITQIQKCLSVGMFGKNRRLVPTKWSITAVDSAISRTLALEVMNMDVIDSWRVFTFGRLGNSYSVILYPHTWNYEMVEAWHSQDGMVFGSDHEGVAGINHKPAIAGAYFAARLGVCEYLIDNGVQAGVLVLREIRPEYSIPVGVWQVREALRAAMKTQYQTASGIGEALSMASKHTSVSATEWMTNSEITRTLEQTTLAVFI